MKNKAKPGVCGTCGRAQVRPEEPITVTNTIKSGHKYDHKGRLVQVRCIHHAGKDDPRINRYGEIARKNEISGIVSIMGVIFD